MAGKEFNNSLNNVGKLVQIDKVFGDVVVNSGTQPPPSCNSENSDFSQIEKYFKTTDRIVLNEIYKAYPEYLELRDKIFSDFKSLEDHKDDEVVNEALFEYLSKVPAENAYSEHLLLVIRRHIASLINKDKSIKYKFILLLLEPELSYKVRNSANISDVRVNYEIASLLAEMGENRESLAVLARIIKKTRESKDSEMLLLSLDRKSVILQNLGLYNEAKKIREEIIKNNSAELEKYAYIKHRIYKHFATLLRRIHYNELKENQETILEYFYIAEKAYDTYHIHFSRGYLYYLLGKNDEAKAEYDTCLEFLEDYQEEYYLIHIKCALVQMRRKNDKDLNTYITKYETSLNEYGNFKTDINMFLLELINICSSRDHLWDPDDLCTKLSELLVTPENLYCIEADIECILEYYKDYYKNKFKIVTALEKIREEIKKVLSGSRSKFEKFSSVLNGTPSKMENSQGIAVHFKIGYNVEKQETDPSLPKMIAELERLLRNYLSDDFDDLDFFGDGYTLIKKFKGNDSIEQKYSFTTKLLEKLFAMLEDTKRNQNRHNLILGIGIGYGKITAIPLVEESREREREILSFFGEAVSRASKMADLAKPMGIVMHCSGEGSYYRRNDLLGTMPLEEVKTDVEFNKSSSAFISSDVTELFGYKYFFRYKNSEKRYFINYFGKCPNKCMYCITQNTPDLNYNSRKFQPDEFEKELKIISANMQLENHLVSIGHLNEPLTDSNYENILTILTKLLETTKVTVQIATKSGSDKIAGILNYFKDYQNRLVVFYSICTLNYSEKLEEGRKLGAEELEKIKALSKFQNLIPYVKPFLPGITDTDENIFKFLRDFKTIVVGYPYLSRQITHQLYMFCADNNLDYAIRGNYYNYSKQCSRLKLSLSHPSLFNSRVYSFNYQEQLEKFVEVVNSAKDKNIFFSSPCAVAFLNKTTCYTNIGDPETEYHKILCLKNKNCGNVHCRFNV